MLKLCHKTILLGCALAYSSTARSVSLSAHEAAYLSEHPEIVIAVPPDNAPYTFATQHQFMGMDIELIHWIAVESGFKVRFVPSPAKEAEELLRTGKVDAVANMPHTEKNEAEFAFSHPFETADTSLFIQRDGTSISTFRDLQNAHVAVLGSGRILESLAQQDIRCEVKFVATPQEGTAMIERGDADALIIDDLVLRHHFHQSGETPLKKVGIPLFTEHSSLAVAKDNRMLQSIFNKGIQIAEERGTADKIAAKWLKRKPANDTWLTNTIITAILATAVVILSILLLILIWNRRLRQSVATHIKLYADSERRLRQFFENSPDAVFVIEASGQISSANSRACELVQMNKPVLLAKTIYDLVPKQFTEDARNNMKLWFDGELSKCEGACQTAAGEIIPIEMTGTLHTIAGREMLQLHAREISLRKEAEARIIAAKQMAEKAQEMSEQARMMAEQSSQAKSEFLANISHEIRTPLNGILGMAQLLMDTSMDDEQKNCADTIMQSSTGLLKIINHVLDISKIEAGKMDVRESVIDLPAMRNTLYNIFSPQARQKGLELFCECDEKVPQYVVGDEGLIEQIMVNLIGNALKFTSKGSIHIAMEFAGSQADQVDLRFRVSDTGIGIGADKLSDIFEKFSQVDQSQKRLYGGTGLGLAICKQLIELMNGTIDVESTEGKGSSFLFTLPLKRPKEAQNKEATTTPTPAKALNTEARVLLVEDNKVNQTVAISMLKKAGFIVTAVDNGLEAIVRIQKEPFDIVLMDCQMPVMDGFEATHRIRQMEEPLCSIPIIAITAHALKADEQKCLDEGMDDYISKPVSRSILIETLNKYTAGTV